jgi:hypothetical protein
MPPVPGTLQTTSRRPALTNHDNERHVKKGANITSTGKSEFTAEKYAIASNGFSEFVRKDEDEEDNATNDDPSRRERGERTLVHLEERVKAKLREVANLATKLGAEAFVSRKKKITLSLSSVADTMREQEAEKAAQRLVEMADKNKSTALSREQGEDVSPLILDYLAYSEVAKITRRGALVAEVQARRHFFNGPIKAGETKSGVMALKDLLKRLEKSRYESEIVGKLAAKGINASDVAKLTLEEKIGRLKEAQAAGGDSTDGTTDIDISKFFKILTEATEAFVIQNW